MSFFVGLPSGLAAIRIEEARDGVARGRGSKTQRAGGIPAVRNEFVLRHFVQVLINRLESFRHRIETQRMHPARRATLR